MSDRPSVNRMLLDMARVTASRSTCSRLAVGAVIAYDGRVLSTGYNGAPSGLTHCRHDPGDDSRCTISVHAEANAIVQAARHGVRTAGSSLYVTHAPCLACSGLILNAGIRAVWFEEYYRSDAGVARLRQAKVSCNYVTNQDETPAKSAPWKWW